jgi:hypothetical protein
MFVNLFALPLESKSFFLKYFSLTIAPATSRGWIYFSRQSTKKKEFAPIGLFKVESRQGNPLGVLCALA